MEYFVFSLNLCNKMGGWNFMKEGKNVFFFYVWNEDEEIFSFSDDKEEQMQGITIS